MGIVSAVCPQCGGKLPIDENQKSTQCPFCSTKVLLTDSIINYNTIYNNVYNNAVHSSKVEAINTVPHEQKIEEKFCEQIKNAYRKPENFESIFESQLNKSVTECINALKRSLKKTTCVINNKRAIYYESSVDVRIIISKSQQVDFSIDTISFNCYEYELQIIEPTLYDRCIAKLCEEADKEGFVLFVNESCGKKLSIATMHTETGQFFSKDEVIKQKKVIYNEQEEERRRRTKKHYNISIWSIIWRIPVIVFLIMCIFLGGLYTFFSIPALIAFVFISIMKLIDY